MLLLGRILFDITATNSEIKILARNFRTVIQGRARRTLDGTNLETPIMVTIPPTDTNNNSGGASLIIIVVAIQNCKIDRNPSFKLTVAEFPIIWQSELGL